MISDQRKYEKNVPIAFAKQHRCEHVHWHQSPSSPLYGHLVDGCNLYIFAIDLFGSDYLNACFVQTNTTLRHILDMLSFSELGNKAAKR